MTTPLALEDPAWRDNALAAIEAYCTHGREFTADDLHQVVGEPASPSEWGALFGVARGAGLIERTGYRTSTRPSRRHGVLGIWTPITTRRTK